MVRDLQLVCYRHAKKLYELGFDREFSLSSIHYWNGELTNKGERYPAGGEHLEAPSVALALKWLRDDHAAQYNIILCENGKYQYSYYDINEWSWLQSKDYNTYEDCEERVLACLLSRL